ncbi:MAG: CPBP family intramembrane metalloprotease [Oscillospiraceae bacterium]|nr:CPBP family intramembrane metalloprotease [Oscillospiraceae bacterium]
MTNKKLTLKRLLIFLLLAFGLAWIPWIIYNKVFGYHEWFEGPLVIVALPTIYAPALANILTRKITGEGWENSLFHFNFKGHLKYYAFALLIPLAQGILTYITMTLAYGHWDFHEMTERMSIGKLISNALTMLALGPLFAWNTFGEEFGWRAYMNQKMEPLLGTAGTVIAGGILWGVWHAPLTVEGHNFGTEYWGYPWLGILYMVLFCTVEGVFLMWLTKKTDSVFPAAVMHACNNMGVAGIGTFFISGVGDIQKFEPTAAQSLLCMIPFAVCAAVMIAVMLRKQKAAPKQV